MTTETLKPDRRPPYTVRPLAGRDGVFHIIARDGWSIIATCYEAKEAQVLARAFDGYVEMRDAIKGALEWYGRPDESANERFERHAEQFYRAHGMLAPGKSEPTEMYGGPEREELRLRLWREWCAKRTAGVDGAMLAALRAADGEGQT